MLVNEALILVNEKILLMNEDILLIHEYFLLVNEFLILVNEDILLIDEYFLLVNEALILVNEDILLINDINLTMIDHDRLFKELLTTFFWEFLELFLPEITTYLERDTICFIDKEVFTDVTAGEKYETDILVKARFRGQESFFLVHLEHQAYYEEDFDLRMYRYFARLYEKYGLVRLVTRIVSTFKFLDRVNSQDIGFNFLGFHVKQYKVGKNNSGKNGHGKKLGFKTLIKPSDKAIKKHYDDIARIIDNHKSAPQEALISKLNPVIRGWVNYYSTVVSKEIFSKLGRLVYLKLKRWGKRRHSKKSGSWVANKYWHTVGGENWVFAATENGEVTVKLFKHSQKEIVRHVKVKGDASPFNGNLKYWSARKGNHPLVPKKIATLLKKQKGKCAHCGLYFREDDLIEIDHIIPKSVSGKDIYDNLQALHRHCHHVKTATDNSYDRHKSDTETNVMW